MPCENCASNSIPIYICRMLKKKQYSGKRETRFPQGHDFPCVGGLVASLKLESKFLFLAMMLHTCLFFPLYSYCVFYPLHILNFSTKSSSEFFIITMRPMAHVRRTHKL